eukprot:13722109-Alexandrium_andersonii.AAC.1
MLSRTTARKLLVSEQAQVSASPWRRTPEEEAQLARAAAEKKAKDAAEAKAKAKGSPPSELPAWPKVPGAELAKSATLSAA